MSSYDKMAIHAPAPFATNVVEFRGDAVFGTVAKGTSKNLDLKVSDERMVNGGLLHAEKAVPGDWIRCQVVDRDGILAPPGTVLKQWIDRWYVAPGKTMDLVTPQAGTVPAGLWLRCVYNSTGQADDVEVFVNYRLNRKL